MGRWLGQCDKSVGIVFGYATIVTSVVVKLGAAFRHAAIVDRSAGGTGGVTLCVHNVSLMDRSRSSQLTCLLVR